MQTSNLKKTFIYSLVVGCGLSAAWLIYSSISAIGVRTVQATSADKFVDFIGINTHLPYADTAYNNFPRVKAALKDLGIRHLRDNSWDHNTPGYYDKLRELSAAGTKSLVFFHGQQPSEVVAIAKSLKGTIDAVEGPNETDLTWLSPLEYKGNGFSQGTRDYQNDIYAALKADSATNYLPVLMPSMGWGGGAEQLGALESGDVGNMHSYPDVGNMPSIHLDSWYLPYAKIIAGTSKPIWSTETGYSDIVSHKSGVSLAAASKYLPRLLLEHWNRQVERVYLYQLIDPRPPESNEQYDHIGLMRYDGTQKPAYKSIKNLIYILSDRGTAKFTLNSLTFSIDGDTNDVNYVLFQKAANKTLPTRFFLVLWQEKPSWDNDNKIDIAVPTRALTLKLSTKIRQAAYYLPLKSTNIAFELKNAGGIQSMRVGVPDHPIILRLIP